ncbi:MAG: hypothetical protein OXF56_22665 [Rhodobacteraceae bacterium]|nr:hypothetical protein [Paracoccaceae bacterium]
MENASVGTTETGCDPDLARKNVLLRSPARRLAMSPKTTANDLDQLAGQDADEQVTARSILLPMIEVKGRDRAAVVTTEITQLLRRLTRRQCGIVVLFYYQLLKFAAGNQQIRLVCFQQIFVGRCCKRVRLIGIKGTEACPAAQKNN